MLIVKIDTVHPIFETQDGHKSVLEALIEVWDFQDNRRKYQKMTFQSICTLQVKMSQLRPSRKNWSLEFRRKRNLKMIVNREGQQLCFFLDYLDFYARFKKNILQQLFCLGVWIFFRSLDCWNWTCGYEERWSRLSSWVIFTGNFQKIWNPGVLI